MSVSCYTLLCVFILYAVILRTWLRFNFTLDDHHVELLLKQGLDHVGEEIALG